MLLRHGLSCGGLRFAQNRRRRPEFAIAHDPAEVLLRSQKSRSHPASRHRAILPICYPVGSDAHSGVWAFDDIVVARQRCCEGGTPNRLTVKRSSSPSSRLAAAEGYSPHAHRANHRMLAEDTAINVQDKNLQLVEAAAERRFHEYGGIGLEFAARSGRACLQKTGPVE
jgi:hypothetical protein